MTTELAHVTVESFNEAFNHCDVDAVMDMVTDDIIFENTSGGRFVDKEAVRAVLARAFELMSMGRFETEELFVAEGDRCVVLWTYSFNRDEPEHGSVRGVDVFRVREGKVAQKLSYVKSEDFVKKLGLELPRV